eukprot:4206147-Amphidinium_carterae.1
MAHIVLHWEHLEQKAEYHSAVLAKRFFVNNFSAITSDVYSLLTLPAIVGSRGTTNRDEPRFCQEQIGTSMTPVAASRVRFFGTALEQ